LQHLIVTESVQTSQAAIHLGVDKRIALADLKTLAAHHVPLRHPSLKNARTGLDRDTAWELEPSWAKLGFQAGIIGRLSLLLGREVIGHFLRGTTFEEKLNQIDTLIEQLTPEVEENIERRFYLKQEPAKQYADRSVLLEDLVFAIVMRMPISFDYVSASGREHRNVKESPLTLIIYRRGLYVAIHRRQGMQRVINLAVDRIKNLVLHENAEDAFDYPPPSEYDPRTYFADIFGIYDDGQPATEVVLHFPATGSQAYVREREWMPNQTISYDEDGAATVRFFARGGELAFRILEYGPFCEVIAPPELRAKVADLARETAALYADTVSTEPTEIKKKPRRKDTP